MAVSTIELVYCRLYKIVHNGSSSNWLRMEASFSAPSAFCTCVYSYHACKRTACIAIAALRLQLMRIARDSRIIAQPKSPFRR